MTGGDKQTFEYKPELYECELYNTITHRWEEQWKEQLATFEIISPCHLISKKGFQRRNNKNDEMNNQKKKNRNKVMKKKKRKSFHPSDHKMHKGTKGVEKKKARKQQGHNH